MDNRIFYVRHYFVLPRESVNNNKQNYTPYNNCVNTRLREFLRTIIYPDHFFFFSSIGVMGRPGVDFPILPSIPRTDFSCKKMKKSGYYADPETDCQVNNKATVFHIVLSLF